MIQVIRPPAVAGTFYPQRPSELRSTIASLLADKKASTKTQPRGLIVPHAGYQYSGPVAATGFAQLMPFDESIRRVMVVGPAHHFGFLGLALPEANGFDTPLGRVPLDERSMERLLEFPQVKLSSRAHQAEHSLEVEVPFLQFVLPGGFELTPLIVGDAEGDAVADVMELFWRDPHALIVVSSDLSHYHDYQTACRVDGQTTRWIESLDGHPIGPDHACGFAAIRGLLRCAKKHGESVKAIDVRNSGDIAGVSDEVVGYGAFVAT